MARRSPRKRNGDVQMEESWAIEDKVEEEIVQPLPEEEHEPEVISDPPEERPHRRSERRRNKKTVEEPDLIMPSIYTETKDGSWLEAKVRRANPSATTTRRTTRAPQQQRRAPEPLASELATSETATGSDSTDAELTSEEDESEEEEEEEEEEEPPVRSPTITARTRAQKQPAPKPWTGHTSANGATEKSTTTPGRTANGHTYAPMFPSTQWPRSSGHWQSSNGDDRPTKQSTSTRTSKTSSKRDAQLQPMDVDPAIQDDLVSPLIDRSAKKSTSRPSVQVQRESDQSQPRQRPRQSEHDSQRPRPKEPSQKRRRDPERSRQRRHESPLQPYHQAAQSGLGRAVWLMTYVWSWLAPTALSIATFLVAIGLLVLLISYLVSLAATSLSTSVSSALAPLCSIPGMSLLSLPVCAPGRSTKGPGKTPVEFDQMMDVQAKFEEVLDEQTVSFNLPLDMKRGETAIRDLRNIVKFSSIPSR